MSVLRLGLVTLCMGVPAMSAFAGDAKKELVLDEMIAEWTAKTGIVIAPASRSTLAKHFGDKVRTVAVDHGAAASYADKIANDFSSTGSVMILASKMYPEAEYGAQTATAGTSAGTASNDGTTAAAGSSTDTTSATGDVLAALETATGFNAFSMFLESWATIKVSVVPVPPRDYAVSINGEDCTVTERSEYKVEPGEVFVKVSRAGKAECTWSGNLGSSARQIIDCKM